MKKSYINIVKEIEEMKADGLDANTIESVLMAKYQESNIGHIYKQAEWEQEEKFHAIEKQHDNENYKGYSNKDCIPWKKRVYIGFIIATIGLPLIGFIAFIYGVFKPGKKQQAVMLLIYSIIGVVFWVILGNFLSMIAMETMEEIYRNLQ